MVATSSWSPLLLTKSRSRRVTPNGIGCGSLKLPLIAGGTFLLEEGFASASNLLPV
jgi:hypothetical protein